MNEQIERRLDAESRSDSRGYVGDWRVGHVQDAPSGVVKDGPARWSPPRVGVEVRRLASVAELLDIATSDER